MNNSERFLPPESADAATQAPLMGERLREATLQALQDAILRGEFEVDFRPRRHLTDDQPLDSRFLSEAAERAVRLQEQNRPNEYGS
jgi:hypothetical protein